MLVCLCTFTAYRTFNEIFLTAFKPLFWHRSAFTFDEMNLFLESLLQRNPDNFIFAGLRLAVIIKD